MSIAFSEHSYLAVNSGGQRLRECPPSGSAR